MPPRAALPASIIVSPASPFGHFDPQLAGIRDHAVDRLSGQRVDTQLIFVTFAQCAVSFPKVVVLLWM